VVFVVGKFLFYVFFFFFFFFFSLFTRLCFMSHKSLPSKFLYIIHANNTVSKFPYFTEHTAFVRLLMKQRKENLSDTMFAEDAARAKTDAQKESIKHENTATPKDKGKKKD
jgi:hypothetical protein